MRNDSSSDVKAPVADDEPSITAVADGPAVTRERAPEIQPGEVLAGRYQVEAIIGKGGSGIVLRAFDRVSATVVAVKVLKSGLTHDPRWEKRFSRELRLGRPVRHPNVCRIFDIGDADGYRFLTMEFATGGTLRDLIKKNGPLRPLSERLADAACAIAGLAAIHEAGIVHRDVKPDNMLRMGDGRLVLSDFGLATDLPDSTMVSVFVGTPHYMAPEVREGDPATARSDVWSLGVVLHEIFVGRRPERRNSRSGASATRSSSSKTSSTIERAMLALCELCLADDPADRPENARTVEKIFEKLHRSPHAILRSARYRLLWIGTSVAAAVAVVLGVGGALNRRAPNGSLASLPRIPPLVPIGEPMDWSKVATRLGDIPGHVHCFSVIDPHTVRVIWGEPRRADDFEVRTGTRRPSPISADAYAIGCPDFFSKSNRLLFTSLSSSGASEIRLLEGGNQHASVVTPGSEPRWLRSGEEFIYTLDRAHAAVYSLPTMRFSLLADSGVGGQLIIEKAASQTADRVALLVTNEKEEWAITIYEGATLDRQGTFGVNAARRIDFHGDGDNLWVSYQLSKEVSTLAKLDWRAAALRHVGRVSGADVIGIAHAGDVATAVLRRISQDAWLHDGSSKTKLTNDGETISAAIAPNGTLLIGRRADDGSYSIWKRRRDGGTNKLTAGPSDVAPDFSTDGRLWAYANYLRKSVMVCASDSDVCHAIRQDEFLPGWPRFSPDGKKLAYVTQLGTPRLVVVSIGDGETRHLGPAHGECPPVWASVDSVWAVEGSPGRYYWSERNATTGQPSGQRLPLEEGLTTLEESRCWPANQKEGSPFFRRLRVETLEASHLVRLAAAASIN